MFSCQSGFSQVFDWSIDEFSEEEILGLFKGKTYSSTDKDDVLALLQEKIFQIEQVIDPRSVFIAWRVKFGLAGLIKWEQFFTLIILSMQRIIIQGLHWTGRGLNIMKIMS